MLFTANPKFSAWCFEASDLYQPTIHLSRGIGYTLARVRGMRLCVSTILSTAPMHETLHLGRAAQNQYTLRSNQGQVNSTGT